MSSRADIMRSDLNQIQHSRFTLIGFQELILRQSYDRTARVALHNHSHAFPDNHELSAAAGVGLLQTHCASV